MTLAVPTFAELYQAAREEIQSRNPNLTDFNEGSNLDAMAGAAAILADEVIRIGISQFNAQFVDTATGADLDALALDRFGLTRKAAQASIGKLTFIRGGSTGTLTVPAGTTVEGTGTDGQKVQVTTDVDAEMAALANTITVRATCTRTGTTGNLADGTLTTIVDTIPGDSTATVTNAERFVGGRVAESDDRFRVRIRRYFQTLRKGTVEALVTGATTVPGVEYATVDEDFILPADGGYVAVYVGDPDGRANTALVDDVEVELENWRAAGVWVQAFASEREEISLVLTVIVRVGADEETLRAAIRTATLAVTDGLAPNCTLYFSQINHAAMSVSDDIVDIAVCLMTPWSPLARYRSPTLPQNAIRVNPEDLTISIVEES